MVYSTNGKILSEKLSMLRLKLWTEYIKQLKEDKEYRDWYYTRKIIKEIKELKK